MKPRTKLEKRVVELSIKLPPLTQAQLKWAIDNIFKPTGYLRKKDILCLECGEVFEFKNSGLISIICGEVCPNCGKELKIIKSNNRTFKESAYYSVFTTSKEFQVLRHFIVKIECKAKQPAKRIIHEVVQNWIKPNGEYLNIARATNGMSFYYDAWIFNSSLELRSDSISQKFDVYAKYIYPNKRIIPELKRNGYTGALHNISPYRLLPGLLSHPQLETLLKAKQFKLLNYFCDGYAITKIDKYWPAIKICIRNNYIVKDVSSWTDYIDLLIHFGKDIRNSYFVCPEDFTATHDKYVEKRNIQRNKIAVEEKKKRAIENEAMYKEFIRRFLNLSISDGEIVIEPLKTVADFISEGDAMHHCVFANNYFSRDDSLILSAKIGGQRIETVQFDLNQLKVIQSRGAFNKNTEYHKRIVELVNQNNNVINNLNKVKLDKAV